METKIYLLYFLGLPAILIFLCQFDLVDLTVNQIGKIFTFWLFGSILFFAKAMLSNGNSFSE